MSDAGGFDPTHPYALSAFVYVERDGQLLVTKRQGGAGAGLWARPGGILEPGETFEECAVRELHEETGLSPSGPLNLIGLCQIKVNGHDVVQAHYACECTEGEVVIDAEHSAFRWVDPEQFRERSFPESLFAALAGRPDQLQAMTAFRDNFDAYLAWRRHRAGCTYEAAPVPAARG